jgi:hypothetical protein
MIYDYRIVSILLYNLDIKAGEVRRIEMKDLEEMCFNVGLLKFGWSKFSSNCQPIKKNQI